jgi:hypothetical protein
MDTHEYVSPSVELEPEEEKSAFDRFAEVFTSPADAFAGLGHARKAPIILWGLAVVAVVTVFAVILLSTNDDVREAAKAKQIEQLDKMHDEGKIDDKAYETQLEIMDTMMSGTGFMIFGAASGALGMALFALFIGLIVFILIRVLQRDNDPTIGYAAALCATLIAYMIQNVEGIITALGMMLSSNPQFRISPVMFGAPESAYLKYFLNLLNPFTIWFIFVLGTGVAVLARSERMKAIVAVAAVWIIGGLIITAIGTLFGTMFVA